MNQKKNEIPNYYLYGTVLTPYGLASVSQGIRQGNKSVLQKTYWDGKIHSLVGSSSLRWALRFYLQDKGYPVNRVWDKDEHINRLTDDNYNPEIFYDDDIFGFALLESVEEETVEGESPPSPKKRGKRNKSGTTAQRTGALSMNNAVSLTPYDGSLKLGAKSGREKDSTSLHFTEYHNTRYQYYFGVNATHLKDCSRILDLIDGIMDIPKVGGKGNTFAYPFCPDSLVFQWTNWFASYVSYCFESLLGKGREFKLTQDFLDEVYCGQVDPDELWIGGPIAVNLQQMEDFEDSPFKRAHLYRNRRELAEDLKQVIKGDLGLEE